MSEVNEAGIDKHHSLNGADLVLSKVIEPQFQRRETFSESGAGRSRLTRKYDGAGLPDVLDTMSLRLDWDLDVNNAATITQLERARAQAGPHELVVWKKRYAIYTAATGQAVFYLPRVDAYTDAITGHTTDDVKAVVTVNDAAVTVDYGTVTSGTTVDSGEVWISNTEAEHPDTGLTCTLFKFGDALSAGDQVVVEYYPRFNVQIQDATDDYNVAAEREDKSILFVEVNA